MNDNKQYFRPMLKRRRQNNPYYEQSERLIMNLNYLNNIFSTSYC